MTTYVLAKLGPTFKHFEFRPDISYSSSWYDTPLKALTASMSNPSVTLSQFLDIITTRPIEILIQATTPITSLTHPEYFL